MIRRSSLLILRHLAVADGDQYRAGAAAVPTDTQHGRAIQVRRLACVRHMVIPHRLLSIITGMRLSMGIAWMAIVASAMLAGSAPSARLELFARTASE